MSSSEKELITVLRDIVIKLDNLSKNIYYLKEEVKKNGR